jgi:hypothetical protein
VDGQSRASNRNEKTRETGNEIVKCHRTHMKQITAASEVLAPARTNVAPTGKADIAAIPLGGLVWFGLV